MGRPTKLTPETHKAIVDALAIGATRKDAALAAGVNYTTFLLWLEKGEAAKSGIFSEFYDAVTQAEGEARLRFTATIAKAAKDGDWRAALEYLSRRDRANWSPRQEITGAEGERFSVTINWGDPYDDASEPDDGE